MQIRRSNKLNFTEKLRNLNIAATNRRQKHPDKCLRTPFGISPLLLNSSQIRNDPSSRPNGISPTLSMRNYRAPLPGSPFLNTFFPEKTKVKVSIGGKYQESKLSPVIISPGALKMWHLSQKPSTNLTLIYSHLTAGEVINLSLDHFRRGNYNRESQHPEMNNSCYDKTVHQLPCTFTAQLYFVLFAVKCGHDREMNVRSKTAFMSLRNAVVPDFIPHAPLFLAL